MEKIPLSIVGLSYSSTQSGAYALVLGEKEGNRRLPIIIGAFEAQAIAVQLENMAPKRPLTHDLFKSFAESFEIKVEEVIVYNLVEGIFYAKIVCSNGTQQMEIDARTSDAIAIAVRFECPIYTYEFILSTAGIFLEEHENEEQAASEKAETKPKPGIERELNKMSTDELQDSLKRAIEEEAYEKASRIRDEINRRKESQ